MVADGDIGDPRPEGLDHAGALVSDDDRGPHEGPGLARHEVGVAHARRHDPHEDLVLRGFREAELLEPEGLVGMAQDGCGDRAAHAASSAVRLAQR